MVLADSPVNGQSSNIQTTKPNKDGFFTERIKRYDGRVTYRIKHIDRNTMKQQIIRPIPLYPPIPEPMLALPPKWETMVAPDEKGRCVTWPDLKLGGTLLATGRVTEFYTGQKGRFGLILLAQPDGNWSMMLSNRDTWDFSGCWRTVIRGTGLKYSDNRPNEYREAISTRINYMAVSKKKALQRCYSYDESIRMASFTLFGRDMTNEVHENCQTHDAFPSKYTPWNGYGAGLRGGAQKLFAMHGLGGNFILTETDGDGAAPWVMKGEEFAYTGLVYNQFDEKLRVAKVRGEERKQQQAASQLAAAERQQAAAERQQAAITARTQRYQQSLVSLASAPISWKGITIGKTPISDTLAIYFGEANRNSPHIKHYDRGGGVTAHCWWSNCFYSYSGVTIGMNSIYFAESKDETEIGADFAALARLKFRDVGTNPAALAGSRRILYSDNYALSSTGESGYTEKTAESFMQGAFGTPNYRYNTDYYYSGRICIVAKAFSENLSDWDLCQK